MRRRQGAALVELVCSFIILIPVLFWLVQMSFIIDATNTVSQISYTTARYAASNGRNNSPTDVADNDYTDSNHKSVLYAAYNACNNSTLIPYGQGAVTGSSNTYAVANANGATITITYASPSGTTEGTSATRNLGDTVTVSVKYDMVNHIFMPHNFPVISSMIQNGHAYCTRVSKIVIIQ